MRAFIAIDLPSNIKNNLSRIQVKLKENLPEVNWVKLQNLHLTLKFLGEISTSQLNNIEQITQETIKTTSDFKIKLDTLGVFPNIHAARIIWIGTDQTPTELKQFIKRLETQLGKCSLTKEEQPFCTHITIGRIKSRKYFKFSDLARILNNVKTDLITENWEFNAKAVTLFQSHLAAGGANYTILKETNFRIT